MRKPGHLLAGRTEICGLVALADGVQYPAEQLPGLVAPAPAPETTQAESGTQLERHGLLLARDLEGPSKAGFGLAARVIITSRVVGFRQQHLAFEPMGLRVPPTLVAFLGSGTSCAKVFSGAPDVVGASTGRLVVPRPSRWLPMKPAPPVTRMRGPVPAVRTRSPLA